MSKKKPKVLAFMITRARNMQRANLCMQTLKEAVETAGMEFDLVLHCMDINWKLPDFKGSVKMWDENVGQHVVMNYMMKKAKEKGYEYLLRLDDDCKFLSKRWLVKMVEAAEKLGKEFIISPTVLGLNHPPPKSETVEVNDVKVKFLPEAIGGVCRLHSMETLTDVEDPYIADVRWPLGFGDATGIGQWCKRAPEVERESEEGMRRWMVYLTQVKVKHSTSKQEKEDEEYHAQHDLFQHLPYIPIIRSETLEKEEK